MNNVEKQEKKQKLVEAIIEELKRDITNNTLWGNIESLLYYSVGTVRLQTFLPKDQGKLTKDLRMKIETDVPLPESSRARKYPFLEMLVGESVYFDGEEVNGRAYRAAMSTGQSTQSKVRRPPRGQWP
jgi:hypothetical protein